MTTTAKNYDKLLDGKVAVVTNGDTPVGRAVALLFARHGAVVAVGTAQPPDAGAAAFLGELTGLSARSFALPCDLSDATSVEAFCEAVKAREPMVHVLVNNPYIQTLAPADRETDADDDIVLQVYQHSLVQTMRAFWDNMLESRAGAVVQISSSGVFKTPLGEVIRTMAEGAHGGMTRVPAVEGGLFSVRVNEIYAAYGVNTPTMAAAPLRAPSGGASAVSARPDVDGVAKAALFLASEMASYVSGVSLSVSGGMQRLRAARP